MNTEHIRDLYAAELLDEEGVIYRNIRHRGTEDLSDFINDDTKNLINQDLLMITERIKKHKEVAYSNEEKIKDLWYMKNIAINLKPYMTYVKQHYPNLADKVWKILNIELPRETK